MKNMRQDPIINEYMNQIITIMHWCKDNDVPYSDIRECAEASFTLATGVSNWDCGRKENRTDASGSTASKAA